MAEAGWCRHCESRAISDFPAPAVTEELAGPRESRDGFWLVVPEGRSGVEEAVQFMINREAESRDEHLCSAS